MRSHFLGQNWFPGPPDWRLAALAYHLLIAALIAPILYLNCYAHPSPVDDYYNSVWSRYGEALQRVYLTNNGRYFSTALTTLNPWHWHSILFYRVANAIIVVLYAWSFAGFIKKLLHCLTDLTIGACRLIAVVTLALLLNNITSHTEGFFWLTGAATYTLSIPLFLWQMTLAMRMHASPSPRLKLAFLFLTILISGSNEVTMVGLGILMAGLIVFYRKRSLQFYVRFYSGTFMLWLLCAGVVLLSPGAWARHGGFHTSLLNSAAAWPFDGVRLFLSWISDPTLLICSAFIAIILSRSRCSKPTMGIGTMLVLLLAVILMLTAIPYFGIGSFPPPRVINVVYALFLIGLIPLLCSLVCLLKKLFCLMNTQSRSIALQAAIILLILSIGFGVRTHNLRASNYYLLARDIFRHAPQQYDAGLQDRYRRMRISCTDCLLTLSPIPFENGNLLAFGDIRSDTAATRNTSYARYWGKRAVRLNDERQ